MKSTQTQLKKVKVKMREKSHRQTDSHTDHPAQESKSGKMEREKVRQTKLKKVKVRNRK